MNPDDLFCLYCQKQYTRPIIFGRHVSTKHPGVWPVLAGKREYAWIEERFAAERVVASCENPF